MERKFYPDSFERILKDHADDFKMYPSDKNWHGIYNNLHPGRRWPSLAMGIMLIISLLIVGRLNTESNGIMPITSASQQQAKTDNGKQSKATRKNSGIETVRINESVNHQSSEELLQDIASPDSETGLLPGNSSMQGGSVNGSDALKNVLISKGSQAKTSIQSSDPSLLNDVVTSDIEGGVIPQYSLALEVVDKYQKSPSKSLIKFPIILAQKNIIDSLKLSDLKTLASANQKNKSKFSWKFHVTTSATYRDFKHEDNEILAPALTTTAAAQNNAQGQITANSLDHRMALGFELGTSLLYDLSKKSRIKLGLQFNYTGYNIRAYRIHPVTSNFLLDNESGATSFVPALSNYSSATGSNAVSLHNQQLQLSFPIGLEFELAQTGKLKLNAGSTFQPTYVLAGTAYIPSTNRKNYIGQSGLLRKWNMSGAIETFVSFKTSNSLTMHIGPQLRYQLLSSYSNKYAHREHLLDVGIKFGVSKTLK